MDHGREMLSAYYYMQSKEGKFYIETNWSIRVKVTSHRSRIAGQNIGNSGDGWAILLVGVYYAIGERK